MIVAFVGNPLLEYDSFALEVGKLLKDVLIQEGHNVVFLHSSFDLFELLLARQELVIVDVADVATPKIVPLSVLKSRKFFTLHDLDIASIIQLSGKAPIIIAIPSNGKIMNIAHELLALLKNILSNQVRGSGSSKKSKDHRHG